MINLANFRLLLADFYDILQRKQTFFEIILNLSFILIIFMFVAIFYWDSINRSVINTSRCKVLINNDDAEYGIDATNSDGTKKLYSIKYDNTKNHNIKIDCACPTGTTNNLFSGIKYFDYKSQEINNANINCKCDADYTSAIALENARYTGDKFLTDFYNKIGGPSGILNFS